MAMATRRARTLQRFGPVRSVPAEHVFELGSEAVNRSTRRKSGLAVRFARILRWRHDKPAPEADRIETLRALANNGPKKTPPERGLESNIVAAQTAGATPAACAPFGPWVTS